MANGSEMRELSIRLGVINSKEFGTEITADIVSEGRTIKTYEVVVFKQVKKATVKKMAEEARIKIHGRESCCAFKGYY